MIEELENRIKDEEAKYTEAEKAAQALEAEARHKRRENADRKQRLQELRLELRQAKSEANEKIVVSATQVALKEAQAAKAEAEKQAGEMSKIRETQQAMLDKLAARLKELENPPDKKPE